MESINASSVRSVLRWVGTGANVVIEGAYGSGRSAVLREVAEELRKDGRETLLVRGLAAAVDMPLGPFLLETHLVEDLGAAPTVAEVVAYVSGRLVSRRSVLLVDDLAYLDSTTAAVLEAAVEGRGAQVVCVCDVGPTPPLVSRLARRAATARVEPLSLRAMSRLLSVHLGSEVAPSVVAEVARAAGGNPGVALALVDAATYSGTLNRSADGLWVLSAPFDSAPLGGVVNASLASVGPERRDALATLALSGAVSHDVARRLVAPRDLHDLVRLGHVGTSPIGGGLLVFVSSPALASALLAELGPLERHDLEARVQSVVRAEPVGADVLDGRTDVGPWAPTVRDRSVGSSTELTRTVTVLTERAQAEAEHQVAAWRRHPVPATGVPLLTSLMMLHRSSTEQIEAVLHETRSPDGLDGLDMDAGWFLVLRALWAAWTGSPFHLDSAVDELGANAGGVGSAVATEVFHTCVRMRLISVDPGAVPVPVATTRAGAGLRLLDRVSCSLDRGAVGEAAAVPLVLHGDEASFLGGLRDALEIDVLVLSGRLDEARSRARSNLESAYASFDLLRIRYAARSVATVAFCSGDLAGTWASLSSVLLLGPTGALTVTIDQRILGLASIVRARAGDLPMAASLLADLRAIPGEYRTGLDFGDAWVEAELLLASDSWSVAAADVLWTAGETSLARGDRTAATFCWALTATPLPPERLRRLEQLWAEVDVPYLTAHVSLHRRLAAGTSDELLRALRQPAITGSVVRNALVVVEERRATEGLAPLTDEEILATAGQHVLDVTGRGSGAPQGARPLSDREHEIVMRARAGQSNAEIAADLFLSRRTVENHLYRALRKLGISGRGELLRS